MQYIVNKITEQINVGTLKSIVDASNETIWATQKAMAELFGVIVPNISYHFKRIFSSGETDIIYQAWAGLTARELLTSDEGLMHRSRRPIEPEA